MSVTAEKEVSFTKYLKQLNGQYLDFLQPRHVAGVPDLRFSNIGPAKLP